MNWRPEVTTDQKKIRRTANLQALAQNSSVLKTKDSQTASPAKKGGSQREPALNLAESRNVGFGAGKQCYATFLRSASKGGALRSDSESGREANRRARSMSAFSAMPMVGKAYHCNISRLS